MLTRKQKHDIIEPLTYRDRVRINTNRNVSRLAFHLLKLPLNGCSKADIEEHINTIFPPIKKRIITDTNRLLKNKLL